MPRKLPLMLDIRLPWADSDPICRDPGTSHRLNFTDHSHALTAGHKLGPYEIIAIGCRIAAARPGREDSHHNRDELGSHTRTLNPAPAAIAHHSEYNRLS